MRADEVPDHGLGTVFSDLSRSERGELCEVLRLIFRKRAWLDEFVLHRLDLGDITLNDISSEADRVPTSIHLVVEYCHSVLDGGLDMLVRQTMVQFPRNRLLPELARRLEDERRQIMTSTRRSVDPDPDAVPHSYLRANTVHFDLTQLSAVIRERLSAEDAVIGFGTTYSDDVFLRKLCERVSYIIGRSLTKDPVSLRPDLRTPQGCIDDLWHYQEDLHRVNVLCVVRADAIVDEAFDSAVAEFWDLAHRAFSKIPQRLILTIVAQPGARFPGGITELPPPRFTQHDVWSWVNDIAHEIEAARGWSLDLREAWNEMLCRSAKSADTASSLDARRLYQAMDQSIRELQIDPEGLRHKLEEVHRDRSAH